MCKQYNEIHIINTRIKSPEDSTRKLRTYSSPPEGVARYCFHPVCLCVCMANILVFYFSAIRRDIDLKIIQDTNGH